MHPLQYKILNIAQEVDVSVFGLRRLAQQIGEQHPQKIKHHLEQLEKMGYVKLDRGKNRIVKVIKKDESSNITRLLKIPIFGSANAGPARIFADQQPQGYLPISQSALGKKNADGIFAVRVVGESLNRAEKLQGGPANNGDYAVIDSAVIRPNSGDYVLSIIEGMANLKRFYIDEKSKEVRLVSESSLNIPPIILHEDDLATTGYMVNGKILKVVKMYERFDL